MLGTSNAWSTIHLCQQTSELVYYIVDWRVLNYMLFLECDMQILVEFHDYYYRKTTLDNSSFFVDRNSLNSEKNTN